LTRVLAILSRGADVAGAADDLASIKAEIEALADSDHTRLSGAQRGISEVKAMALHDIAEFEARRATRGDTTTVREFLRQTAARYEQILARLAPG
jgi:hypothetical protein